MKKQTISFELTSELKSLVKAVVAAKLWIEVVYPIVTGYQRAILMEIGAVDNKGIPITDPKRFYLMDDEKVIIYLARCSEEADKHQLRHKPECCPLIEAESHERRAKRAFCEYIIPKLPGYEHVTYDSLNRFSKNADGSVKEDKLGRKMFIKDEIIEFVLKGLAPQIVNEW